MNDKPIHLLNQLGVLASFSVAKKVDESYIQDFFNKEKKKGKSNREINKLIKDKIINEIQAAVENNKIPGLLSSQELARQLGMDEKVVKNIPILDNILLLISTKLKENKYDAMSLCYFINRLVNELNLTEEDFQKFHCQNVGKDDEVDDNDDDDDDDDDDNEPTMI